MRTLLLILFLVVILILATLYDMVVDWILWLGGVLGLAGFENDWGNMKAIGTYSVHVFGVVIIGLSILIVMVLVHAIRRDEGGEEESVWVG